MCGIYGQWDLAHRPIDLAAVQRATALLRHRGPDDEGYLLVDSRAGEVLACAGADTSSELRLPPVGAGALFPVDLALGFRRLAIVDLSPAGHQPMVSHDRRCWIVFNGEIYNYAALRHELTLLGHEFRSDTDTEVVLAAFQAWGERCLQRFNGMWAFAIYDTAAHELFLARDRFGVKPLVYALADGRFRFASELKALVGSHGVRFDPCDRAVHDFLVDARLPNERKGETFLRPVRALPGGHCMRVSARGVAVQRYYNLPEERRGAPSPPHEVVAEFRELLDDAVRLRLRADVSIGTCLSGGLDSSAIVCLVNRMLDDGRGSATAVGARQRTFSAVYDEAARYNERPYVDQVLRSTGADGHFVFPTAERLSDDLPALVWHQDEPFNSTSIFAQWCVMSTVRASGVTVLLDGQGADESLGGYAPFDIVVSDLLRRGQLLRALNATRAMSRTGGVAAAPILARAVARQLPAQLTKHGGRRRARTRTFARIAVEEPTGTSSYATAPHRGFRSYADRLIEQDSLPSLLRYEDRNSMAFSVEGRVPYLDYRLVEFALTTGSPWVLHEGWTKWVLRQAVRDVVPSEITWRHDKVGFETPERRWMSSWIDRQSGPTFSTSAPSAEYLEVDAVTALLDQWRGGGRGTRQLWRCINLELWLRAFA